MRRFVFAGVYTLICLCYSVKASAAILVTDKAGSELTELNSSPSVAVDSNGRSLIVWVEDMTPLYIDESIMGRFIDKDGNFPGSKFKIDSGVKGLKKSTHVALTNNGTYLVVWVSDHSGENHIYGRVLDSSGSPLGDEFQVDMGLKPVSNFDPHISLAMRGNGEYIVAWNTDDAIYMNCYDSKGASVLGSVRVDKPDYDFSYTPPKVIIHTKENQDISINGNGTALLVWRVGDNDGNIYARRMNTLCGLAANEIKLTNDGSYTNPYSNPKVLIHQDGGYTIFWYNNFADDIKVKRYGPDSAVLIDEQQVAHTKSSEYEIGLSSDGNIQFFWDKPVEQNEYQFRLFSKQLSSDGFEVSPEYRVDTDLVVSQYITENATGHLSISINNAYKVLAWNVNSYIGINIGLTEHPGEMPSGNSGGGGGCSLYGDSRFDPLLPLLVLVSIFYLLIRKEQR